ncbi:MAG: paraquat-inducible protein A [Epsilonproteobacteria bacterium]|nr:paraquat-inducible protein A [Campylobacterota bacterium]
MGKFKKLLLLLPALLLIALIYLSVILIDKGHIAKIYKSEYATLHSSEFGMFNSDLWTEKIIKIMDTKIENFSIQNAENREEIKGYISTIIETLIEEAQRAVKERNTHKRGFLDSILGSTKQMITDSIIDFKDLRERVPEFTDRVLKEIEKPENQARAKTVLREKVKEFMHNNIEKHTDMTAFNTVLKRYNTISLEACNAILDEKMQTLEAEMHHTMETMLVLAFIIIVIILFYGTLNTFTLLLLSGTTIALLVSGIFLPMLDIEAKIAQLNFTILDNTVVFHNQILFFQSKSISDLVTLLLDSDKLKMKFVGVLLVMFSVIFPTLKLISTTLYFYSKSIIGNNPVTRFFALKSTKWSMADVFVVSIFMAYLGLDGVVSNELKRLEGKADPVNIITTNGTHLEVGFFLFLGFVLTSFVLAYLVHKKKSQE